MPFIVQAVISLPFFAASFLIPCVTPPLFANILPKYDALSSGEHSRFDTSISLASRNACNSSNDITQSIAPPVLGSLYSSFFAEQGPINITFAVGSPAFIIFAVTTIGETFSEIYSLSSGKFFSTYITKAGQHELNSTPFLIHSSASRSKSTSAPKAASTTW